ncbi:unnamed protein product [Caenorhabditis angaria]|uniref:C-type lectin domain-containing protein n=1 Tax=Caenorhabditis angaria TaxID=860376 RepID=A0A9P1IHM0_9PELO|nr:unnamed protein product [Caenorhabditis angaria]
MGEFLSGVENEHEKNWIHEKGVHLLRHHHKHIHQGALWIGGRRRPGCLGVNKNKAGCVPWAPHAFEWTDGFTTGRSQFRFRPGQPDYLHNAQEFVYMHIIDRPYGKGDHGATPGSLDDVTGDTAMTGKNTLQFVRGIVCGKRAAR